MDLLDQLVVFIAKLWDENLVLVIRFLPLKFLKFSYLSVLKFSFVCEKKILFILWVCRRVWVQQCAAVFLGKVMFISTLFLSIWSIVRYRLSRVIYRFCLFHLNFHLSQYILDKLLCKRGLDFDSLVDLKENIILHINNGWTLKWKLRVSSTRTAWRWLINHIGNYIKFL